MSEEFCLSSERKLDPRCFYWEKDVKEFIRLLKEITKDCMSGGCDEKVVMDRIDKLAGEKLI